MTDAVPFRVVIPAFAIALTFLSLLPSLSQAGSGLDLEGAIPSVVRISADSVFPLVVHRHRPSSSHHQECRYRVGTAVVVDEQGLLVAPAKVAVDGSDYRIVLGKETVELELAGVDELSGMALFRDTGKHVWRVPEFSNKPETGTFLVLISREGVSFTTLSLGLLNGVARRAVTGRLEDFVRFSPLGALSRSGAALFDLEGRLVGLYAPHFMEEGTERISRVAIPAFRARELVTEMLRNSGNVRRPYLGVQLEGPTLELDLGANPAVENIGSLYISGVHPDSPAKAAGLAAGDRIVAVDGQKVTTLSGLVHHLWTRGIGQTLPMLILRDGAQQEISVTLGERPSRTWPKVAKTRWAGLLLANRRPKAGQERGVIVEKVISPPLAGWLGLKEGDILLEINGKILEDISQLEEETWQPKLEGTLTLKILRKEQPLLVQATALQIRVDQDALALRLLRLEAGLRQLLKKIGNSTGGEAPEQAANPDSPTTRKSNSHLDPPDNRDPSQ